MKKLLFILTILSLSSCNNEVDKNITPEEEEIYIQLEFINQDGSIEKSTILQVR